MAQSSTANCRHHWLLSGPKRGIIHGICKNCRATREYPAAEKKGVLVRLFTLLKGAIRAEAKRMPIEAIIVVTLAFLVAAMGIIFIIKWQPW